MNWVDIHDQLKATNKTDWKSRFRYYLSVLFFNTNSDPVNAHIIYKKKVNAKMSLFHFKFILAEFLINKFFSQKRKFTSKEPQPVLELPLALKEQPTLFSSLRSIAVVCIASILGTKIQVFAMFPSVFRCPEVVSSFNIYTKDWYNILTMQ